jgi:hypothetical protein
MAEFVIMEQSLSMAPSDLLDQVADAHREWCLSNCSGGVKVRKTHKFVMLEFEVSGDAIIYELSAPKEEINQQVLKRRYGLYQINDSSV